MTKRMLIDAAHPEESRVVVLDGNRLVEFDYETSTKKQIKGNIYLAKVTRVEPSLQAAFVEYGGNRHGFLAFNEIHPDYYRIPMADREAAIEAERVAEAAENQREEEREEAGLDVPDEPAETHDGAALDAPHPELASEPLDAADHPAELDVSEPAPFDQPESDPGDDAANITDVESLPAPLDASESTQTDAEPFAESATGAASLDSSAPAESTPAGETAATPTSVETLGGDEIEEARRPIRRPFRHYKIQ
ncbi:MAG: ribonuclease E/G, partial [Stellaceae bacterium]